MNNIGTGYNEFGQQYWLFKYGLQENVKVETASNESFIWVLGANFVKADNEQKMD